MIGDGLLQLTETPPGAMTFLAAINANFAQLDAINPWSRMGTAGETLAGGEILALNGSAKLVRANADGGAGLWRAFGIAAHAANLDDPLRYTLMGQVSYTHAETPGAIAYLNGSGAAVASHGGAQRILGMFGPANTLFLYPFQTWTPA